MERKTLIEQVQADRSRGDHQAAYLGLLRLCLLVDESMEAGSYAEMAAQSLQKLGRHDEAIVWMERAILEQPDFPPYEQALERARHGKLIDD